MTGNEHFYLDWQFLIYSTLVLGWLFWRKNYQFRLKRETKYQERASRSNWWFVPLTWLPPNEVLVQHLCTGLYISFLLLACNTKLLDMKWKDTQQQQKKPISKNSIHYSISREHYGTLLLILSFFFFTLFSKSCTLLLIHITVRPWDTRTFHIYNVLNWVWIFSDAWILIDYYINWY